ncbi:Mevalonate kinase [Thelohanellus kitauei]|uniref:mevalonate kinase n=1 Tax=Thelohanellus kitauei TaxID=669202 RepID=A0A0C2NHA7_THEKT|nr:Mevalonate kinase [Thelohanellus kitauei]
MGLNIEISCNIPLASGLGSSAAFSSCLSALVLTLDGRIDASNFDNNLSLINSWAFWIEHMFHGKPSGMDNTCVVYGGLILYQSTRFEQIQTDFFENIEFLVINTGKPKQTLNAVNSVLELRNKFPDIIDGLFTTIDSITKEFVKGLGSEGTVS